jgi:hypothetical protein
MVGYIVRFTDYTYYNINEDEDWVRFMGTTDKGSYYSEVPWVSSRVFRENREKFKEKTIECLSSCITPCQIEL